jgi:molybdate transport system substrate-binding protein
MSRVAVLLVAAALLATACGRDSAPAVSGEPSGHLTVFAAASLRDAFVEIGALFEEQYPGVNLSFNFGGSPLLRLQLEQGARADVYASADLRQMELAVDAGLADSHAVFATNALVIVAPPRNPAGVSDPEDLGRRGLRLVLANPEVPVGAYTRELLSRMEADAAFGPGFKERVLRNVLSNESNVKQVVAKVELGEADAGVVYASDVRRDLVVVPVPTRLAVAAEYPIALLKEARNPAAATAFVEFVLSPAGQEVLRKHGFNAGS